MDNVWDNGEESDTKVEPLIEGMVEVKLSKETKARIRAPWSKALIVKVFGRTVGNSYLSSKLNALWKLVARLDCVNLGKDYFLIKFHCADDYDQVLRGVLGLLVSIFWPLSLGNRISGPQKII